MAYAERFTFPVASVTTNSSGDATAYTNAITGPIHSIRYVADGTNPYANTVDFTFSGETTGANVLTIANVSASATYYPRAVATKAADGSASTLTEVPTILVGERLKLVIAQGGDTKLGVFYVTVGGQ